MAAYQVRSSRLGDGRYQFSYGKGSEKLQAVAWNNEVAGGWQVDGDGSTAVNADGPYRTKKLLKEVWGAWAEANHGSAVAESPGPTEAGQPTESAPTPPARKGPPRHKPSLREKGPPRRTRTGPPRRPPKRTAPANLDDAADPFDPRFRHPSSTVNPHLRRQTTPLGAIVGIYFALADLSHLNNVVLNAICRECRNLIARECPDLITENGNVRKPTEATPKQPINKPGDGLNREALAAAVRGGGAGEVDPDDIPF